MFGKGRLRLRLLRPVAVLLLLLLASAGVAGASSRKAPTAAQPCDEVARFDAASFPDRPSIDNRFLLIVPGTQDVLEGTVDGVFHRVTFTVTDLTKEIDDVHTLVIWDLDESEGEVLESELAFFAQDKLGNVWNLGEYPEEFENGEFAGAPSTWMAGEEGAQAGIHLPAHPQVSTSFYLQGFAPAIHFLDCARVAQMGTSVGAFRDVLVTEETNPNDPAGGTQRKHHAPGVGIVKIDFLNPGSGDEVLELVSRKQLSREELREARREALRLDRRGSRFSDVYGMTKPAERL